MNEQNNQNDLYQPNNGTPDAIEPATPTEPTPAPFPAQVTNKGGKGLKVTIALLVILLLGALGTVAYLLFFQPKAADSKTGDTPQTTQNNTVETPAPASAATIVQRVKGAVTEALKTDYPSTKITDGTSAPTYQADNVSYAVRISGGGSSIDIDTTPGSYNETAVQAARQAVMNALALETSLKKIEGDWNVRYQSDTVTCSVIKDGNPVSLTCADTAAYSDAITKVAPYAAAYLASAEGKKYGNGVVIELQKVTEKTDGYKNAWTSMGNIDSPVGGYAGIFYYANGQWTYWRGTQYIISCTDYNTRDLQKAFEGDSCHGEATQENDTVKVTL